MKKKRIIDEMIYLTTITIYSYVISILVFGIFAIVELKIDWLYFGLCFIAISTVLFLIVTLVIVSIKRHEIRFDREKIIYFEQGVRYDFEWNDVKNIEIRKFSPNSGLLLIDCFMCQLKPFCRDAIITFFINGHEKSVHIVVTKKYANKLLQKLNDKEN